MDSTLIASSSIRFAEAQATTKTIVQNRFGSYRATARAVGVVWLAGFVLAVVGNGVIQSIVGAPDHLSAVSANSMQVAIGALLMLTCSAAEVALGVLMFPVLKRHRERIAFG